MKRKKCQRCKKLVKMVLGIVMANGGCKGFVDVCPECDTEQVKIKST